MEKDIFSVSRWCSYNLYQQGKCVSPSERFVIYISVTLLCLCSGEGPSLRPDQQGEEVKDHGNSAQTWSALGGAGDQNTGDQLSALCVCVCGVRVCVFVWARSLQPQWSTSPSSHLSRAAPSPSRLPPLLPPQGPRGTDSLHTTLFLSHCVFCTWQQGIVGDFNLTTPLIALWAQLCSFIHALRPTSSFCSSDSL